MVGASTSGTDATTKVIKTERTTSDHEKLLRLDRNLFIGAVIHRVDLRVDLFFNRRTNRTAPMMEQHRYTNSKSQYVRDFFKYRTLKAASPLVCVNPRGI